MRSLSLRARLLLWSGAASTVTLVCVIALVDRTFRENIREQLESELAFAVQVAEDARARQMDALIAETINLSMDARLRAAVETGDPATTRQTLAEVFGGGPTGWAAVVLPADRVLASTGRTPTSRLVVASGLIQEARHYDTADLWREGQAIIQVAASAILFGNDPLAILITGRPLDRDGLTALEGAVRRPIGLLVGDRLMLGTEAEQIGPRGQADLLSHASGGMDGLGITVLGSERYLTASVSLPSSEDTAGDLVLLASFDQALRPSNTLRAMLIGIFLLGLLLTFGVSAVFSRGITAPVGRLLEDTERLASGNLDDPVVPLREDEIGRLARAFDDMRVSLKTANAELIRVERLGAIGRAASAVAHDFAQPISTIAMAVGLLRMDEDSARSQECCDAIEAELDRLKRMKQEVVEFARGESSLDAAVVRIDGFLENVASGFRAQLEERDIRLEIEHGYAGEWLIDSYRMGRVIQNLTRNAAAAIGRNGTINIRSEGGECLRLQVKDDGPGIPEAILHEMFEPFVTHGKKEGTGLGLAIARNVVAQHGGVIHVATGAEGTCFTIELPQRHAPRPEAAPARSRELASV